MRLIWIAVAAGWALSAFAQEPCPAPTQWTPCDFAFELDSKEAAVHPDAYATVQLHGEFRSPKSKTFLLPAFWDGGKKFVIRMAPTEPGEWTFRLTSNIERFNGKVGTFLAVTRDAPPFVHNANVHHWQTNELKPHLYMGDSFYRIGYVPQAEFDSVITARAEQKFTHIRGLLLGEEKDQSHAWNGKPNASYFQDLDKRLLAMNQKGMVFDLILGDTAQSLRALLPTWQERERFVRYMISRYAAYNIMWQMMRSFEGDPDGRELTKELGLLVKKVDPYEHPKTPGAALTSSPLLGDQWMNYVTSQNANIALGSIEHQFYTLPFVNAVSGKDEAEQRRALWNSTMNGAYPIREGGPENSAMWKAWHELFGTTRYWELEPYFYVDGGRGIALTRDFEDESEGVEYIIYVEKPGPLEVTVKRHNYDVRWINPATGEVTKLKDWKGDHFTGEPPTNDHDWVLHLSRDGKKESLKSYKFESRPVPLQEVETQPKMVPFDILTPAEGKLSMSKDITFTIKLKRDTRATRSMVYLWTGEVVADGRGARVLGTGKEGTFRIPRDLVKNFPAVLSLRVSALNANGKAYMIDRVYTLVP